MAEQFIKRLIEKTVNGEKTSKEVTYRVDADFVPTSPDEICDDFVENYCVANGKLNWLLETVDKKTKSKKKVKKDGVWTGEYKEEDMAYTWANIRSDFIKEYFPELIKSKTAKNKKLSFAARIKEKYGKK